MVYGISYLLLSTTKVGVDHLSQAPYGQTALIV